MGCTTVQTVPTDWAQVTASIAQPLAQGATPLVLNKNPDYAPALLLFADAIPLAFAVGDLTPESISQSIALLDTKANLQLDADVQSLISTALAIAIQQYQQRAGTTVSNATDPNVKLILSAFAKGIHDGVTAWNTSHIKNLQVP
jgi:hypothetical protein